MRGLKKRLLSAVLVAALVMTAAMPAFGASQTTVKTAAGADALAAMEAAAAYVSRTVTAPEVASIGGEWAVLGLARSGYAVDGKYYDKYCDTVAKTLDQAGGVLHARKYTEYSRVVLALTAIGKDVTDVGGYNLLERLADFESVKWQGINGPIFALIALDSHDYAIPTAAGVKTQTTRELLLSEILAQEITAADGTVGGFALSGNVPDPDVTGMALQALAAYQDQSEAAAAAERALAVLASMQEDNGGFESWGVENMESVAQGITGKSALYGQKKNSTATAAAFIRDCGKNVDALLEYQQADGSFAHVLGQGSNLMATEQALYALTAYVRALQGKNALYDMSDVTIEKALTAAGEKPSGGTVPSDGVKVTIDGTAVAFTEDSGSPFIDENNRTQVPLRLTMERYGCRVEWDAKARAAVVEKDGTTVRVPVGQAQITITDTAGERTEATDTAAIIRDGRTYLPIRAVLEAFGAKVSWQAETKTVVIK